MTRRKNETPEQKLARWMADPVRRTISLGSLYERGWEAGQVSYMEINGLRYERFDLEDGGFCVIEWSADGECIGVA